MIKKQSKSGIKSLVLMLFTAVLLIAAVFGHVTNAWFTDEVNAQFTGTTPIVVVSLKKDTSTAWEAGNTYVYTSGAFSTFGFNTYGSNINTYVRVRVACNYTSNDMSLGSVYDVLTFTLNGNWHSSTDNTTDNKKLESGWIYYYGNGSSLAAVEPSSSLINIFSSVSGSVESSVDVKIYVEAVQANATGLAKWTDYSA